MLVRFSFCQQLTNREHNAREHKPERQVHPGKRAGEKVLQENPGQYRRYGRYYKQPRHFAEGFFKYRDNVLEKDDAYRDQRPYMQHHI